MRHEPSFLKDILSACRKIGQQYMRGRELPTKTAWNILYNFCCILVPAGKPVWPRLDSIC
jgi:hypothetical protein